MRFKRNTAVRPAPRNILGRRARRRLTVEETILMEQSGLGRDEFLDLLDRGYLLPMLGGTTAINQLAANAIYFPSNLVVTSDQTINQGDLVWWDDVRFTLKAVAGLNNVPYNAGQGNGGFCGAAAGTNNPNVYPNPPAGAPSEALPGIAVQRGGSCYVKGTTGDGTYFPFEPVTVGADAQTVSRQAQTLANRVGFVIVKQPVTARGAAGATPAPETVAGSSTHVELWIETKFPDTALL